MDLRRNSEKGKMKIHPRDILFCQESIRNCGRLLIGMPFDQTWHGVGLSSSDTSQLGSTYYQGTPTNLLVPFKMLEHNSIMPPTVFVNLAYMIKQLDIIANLRCVSKNRGRLIWLSERVGVLWLFIAIKLEKSRRLINWRIFSMNGKMSRGDACMHILVYLLIALDNPGFAASFYFA